MNLEEVLLRKEELPIIGENRFQVPIHPSLLREDVVFDPRIASALFSTAAYEWYRDLREYVNCLSESTQDERERKRWLQESYLDKPVKIVTDEYGRQKLRQWEDLVHCDDQGFVTCFDISRNAGGSLYLDRIDECEKFVMNRLVQFSDEKKQEYCTNPDDGCTKMIMYSMHNVDYYQGALFLRNWAMLYLNEALRETERQGKL